MFKLACGAKEVGGWGLAPSEFWAMSPPQWWALWEFNNAPMVAAEKEQTQTMDRLKRLYFSSKGAA